MATSALVGHRVRDRKALSREEEGRMPDRPHGPRPRRVLRAA